MQKLRLLIKVGYKQPKFNIEVLKKYYTFLSFFLEFFIIFLPCPVIMELLCHTFHKACLLTTGSAARKIFRRQGKYRNNCFQAARYHVTFIVLRNSSKLQDCRESMSHRNAATASMQGIQELVKQCCLYAGHSNIIKGEARFTLARF